jgi:hypothetical protein
MAIFPHRIQWKQIAVSSRSLQEFAAGNIRKGAFVRLEGEYSQPEAPASTGRFSSPIAVSGPASGARVAGALAKPRAAEIDA